MQTWFQRSRRSCAQFMHVVKKVKIKEPSSELLGCIISGWLHGPEHVIITIHLVREFHHLTCHMFHCYHFWEPVLPFVQGVILLPCCPAKQHHLHLEEEVHRQNSRLGTDWEHMILCQVDVKLLEEQQVERSS